MTKQILGTFFGVIASIFLLTLGSRFFGPMRLAISQVSTSKESSFDVTGDGEVTSSPDRAVINMGVTLTEASVKQVQDKGNLVIKNITDEILNLGVKRDDIRTTNYSLYPSYDFQRGQKIAGYNLNVNLEVKVEDFEKINQIIDSATANGANQVGGISFTFSDDLRRKLEDQVREVAIGRAKQKALSLARIAGINLGKIINVVENSQGGMVPPIMLKAVELDAARGGGESPTTVEPGSTTFRMSVTLSYETL